MNKNEACLFDEMNPSQSYRIIQYNLWLTVKTYSEAFQRFSEVLEKEFLLYIKHIVYLKKTFKIYKLYD